MQHEYIIEFFDLVKAQDAPRFNLRHKLDALLGRALVHDSGSGLFEIKYLAESNGVFTGAVLKYRRSDLPHKGVPGRREEELGLRNEEGIIEKTHFLIAPPRRILLQRNRSAAHHSRLASLLSHFLQADVTLAPVITPNGLQKLLTNKHLVTAIDVTIAAPSPDQVAAANPASSNWNEAALDIVGGAGAATVRMSISGNLHTHDGRRYLKPNAAEKLVELINGRNNVVVTKAQAHFDAAGGDEKDFVDLLQDRVVDSVFVDNSGRYANTAQILHAMTALHRRHPRN